MATSTRLINEWNSRQLEQVLKRTRLVIMVECGQGNKMNAVSQVNHRDVLGLTRPALLICEKHALKKVFLLSIHEPLLFTTD